MPSMAALISFAERKRESSASFTGQVAVQRFLLNQACEAGGAE